MSEPLEELRAGQKQIARAGFLSELSGGPLDEFPVRGVKLFLFRGPFGDHFGQLRE